MKVLVINGPNMNLLGIREKELYGEQSYEDLCEYIRRAAEGLGMEVTLFQHNCEGRIVTEIQNALGKFEGIVINAAAYSHTSIAILDALKAVALPAVEVHLTDVGNRESFRCFSYVAMGCEKSISGKGFAGYKLALEHLAGRV